MTPKRLFWIDIGCKIGLVVLLLHAVVFSDLAQYRGKGIGVRLATYPITTVVVPIVWVVVRRRRPQSDYPYLIDICVVAPFLIDTLGNALNLYDTIEWWDDAMHLVTWVPWVVAFGLAMRYRAHLRRFDVVAITIGFGAVTHIIWELLEYEAFIRGNANELRGAYTDTLGDLLMSLCGSIIGGILVGTVLWRLGPGGTGANRVATPEGIPLDSPPASARSSIG
jgi:hypothetical protein